MQRFSKCNRHCLFEFNGRQSDISLDLLRFSATEVQLKLGVRRFFSAWMPKMRISTSQIKTIFA